MGVNYIDTYDPWDQNLIDQPLDILFALDQVAAHPPEGLEGMIDAERAGVMGYSFDGYNALAMSGARVDPQNYLDRCANPASVQPAVSERLSGCIAHSLMIGINSLLMQVKRLLSAVMGYGSR